MDNWLGGALTLVLHHLLWTIIRWSTEGSAPPKENFTTNLTAILRLSYSCYSLDSCSPKIYV